MGAHEEAEKKLIVALDFQGADEAYAFWRRLGLRNAIAKIGLELLFRGGTELIGKLASEGTRVFADAKLLDIGNTVERAAAQIAGLGAEFLTVHAQDIATCEAAARARKGTGLKLLGVTLLTSTKPQSLPAQGLALSASELVLRRASFASEAGFEGVVTSPLEASEVKQSFGSKLAVVCPGVRLAGNSVDDQARTSTPSEALRAGADFLVIGRPITRASDPQAAARAILNEMTNAAP